VKRISTDYAVVVTRAASELDEDLLVDLPLALADLEQMDFMPLKDFVTLLERYTHLQSTPDWGFKLGQRFNMAHHGSLGFGAMSAPTIREALVFLGRYVSTRASYIQGSISHNKETLNVEFRFDPEMLRFAQRISETLCVTFQSLIESVGGKATKLTWGFPYPQPGNIESYGDWLLGAFNFGTDCLSLAVPNSVANVQSAFRNDVTYQSALAQCESLLVELTEKGLVEKATALLASRLDQRVNEEVPVTTVPTAGEIADHFGVSRRTFIRQFNRVGKPFQLIKDQLLKSQMERLVRTDLTLAEVAERLGYTDSANLTRACKRLFGQTPSVLRKRVTQESYGSTQLRRIEINNNGGSQ
jgi:AraC-like DNA-binding protein